MVLELNSFFFVGVVTTTTTWDYSPRQLDDWGEGQTRARDFLVGRNDHIIQQTQYSHSHLPQTPHRRSTPTLRLQLLIFVCLHANRGVSHLNKLLTLMS